MGLCCLSTRVSAIPELILDGETGVLVAPGAPKELGSALARLIRSPSDRHKQGLAAAKRVRSDFSSNPGLDRLAEKFRKVL
jgi:glycosyltransferase involved in cell wall biosynthesis